MNIVGIVKDFHYKPMQHAMAPMALYNFGSNTGSMLRMFYIRIMPEGVRKSLDWIRTKVCESVSSGWCISRPSSAARK